MSRQALADLMARTGAPEWICSYALWVCRLDPEESRVLADWLRLSLGDLEGEEAQTRSHELVGDWVSGKEKGRKEAEKSIRNGTPLVHLKSAGLAGSQAFVYGYNSTMERHLKETVNADFHWESVSDLPPQFLIP